MLLRTQIFFCMDRPQDFIVAIDTKTEEQAQRLARQITLFLREQKDEQFENLFVDILKRPIKGHLYPELPKNRAILTKRLIENKLMRESSSDLSEHLIHLQHQIGQLKTNIIDSPVPN